MMIKPKTIKRLREKLGNISQARLGELVGVDQATISRAEAGGFISGPLNNLLERMAKEQLG